MGGRMVAIDIDQHVRDDPVAVGVDIARLWIAVDADQHLADLVAAVLDRGAVLPGTVFREQRDITIEIARIEPYRVFEHHPLDRKLVLDPLEPLFQRRLPRTGLAKRHQYHCRGDKGPVSHSIFSRRDLRRSLPDGRVPADGRDGTAAGPIAQDRLPSRMSRMPCQPLVARSSRGPKPRCGTGPGSRNQNSFFCVSAHSRWRPGWALV